MHKISRIATLASAALFCFAPIQAPAAEGPGADERHAVDLAQYLDLAEFYVAPPTAKRDPVTGFHVGGLNETPVIERLTELNGRKIADLEADMRPGSSSTAGFLGADEKLLDLLADDNRYVVQTLRLTHQELARHLHALATIGWWQQKHHEETAPFVYRGRRFKVTLAATRGSQPSPFNDGTESGADATLENLDNGRTLKFALLVPYMIERYGFYEGRGTSYRVEPRQIVEVLDFLDGRHAGELLSDRTLAGDFGE
jgi:hypothetical protein